MAFVTPGENLAGMQPDRTPVWPYRCRERGVGLWAARAAEGFGLFLCVGAAIAHAAVMEGA